MKTSVNPEVEKYFKNYPPETRKLLEKVRQTILNAAPGAGEKIGYGIPTVTLNGNLVHYAAFKNHIGFYPGAAAMEVFKERFSNYKNAKGSVQFPLSEPIPYPLITEIVEYRVKENSRKPDKPSR